MKLPNGEIAVVEIAKLREYCLSAAHPRGRHKARVFLSVLGMNASDAEELRVALLQAAGSGQVRPGAIDQYGTRYIIDFKLKRSHGAADIRSTWILRTGESAPRFVTCFVI